MIKTLLVGSSYGSQFQEAINNHLERLSKECGPTFHLIDIKHSCCVAGSVICDRALIIYSYESKEEREEELQRLAEEFLLRGYTNE